MVPCACEKVPGIWVCRGTELARGRDTRSMTNAAKGSARRPVLGRLRGLAGIPGRVAAELAPARFTAEVIGPAAVGVAGRGAVHGNVDTREVGVLLAYQALGVRQTRVRTG